MATNQGNTYKEDTIEDFGVSHIWYNCEVIDSITTKRGTLIEMVKRPGWGIACYMNNSIQSCEVDERIYHEALVHPVMSSVENPKRVMIIGGGEGATAREVLKWNEVEKVDMYEWDEDVVKVFKEKYPQWANGAWDDERLTIHYKNIFEEIKNCPEKYEDRYDVIIIDLFDPCEENKKFWQVLLQYLPEWCKKNTSVVMYAGMRNILVEKNKQPYHYLMKLINDMNKKTGHEKEHWRNIIIEDSVNNDKEAISYKLYIPSFSGESTFLLLKDMNYMIKNTTLYSHITESIWKSYTAMNW